MDGLNPLWEVLHATFAWEQFSVSRILVKIMMQIIPSGEPCRGNEIDQANSF